jgi:hypothetical protein
MGFVRLKRLTLVYYDYVTELSNLYKIEYDCAR